MTGHQHGLSSVQHCKFGGIVACVKCATPLPSGDHTLAQDHTLATAGQGWSVPAADGIVTAAPRVLGPGTLLGERYEIIRMLARRAWGRYITR